MRLPISWLNEFVDVSDIPVTELAERLGVSQVTVRKDLFLHSKCEGVLCAFFTCIGQRKHGQRVSMNWSAVTGARGRAKVGKRTYNGNTYNEIKRFLEPPETGYAAPVQQAYPQSYTQPAPQTYAPPANGYTPGKF